MKETVNRIRFHDAFREMDRLENFSFEGRDALFEFLESLEEEMGKEIELDVIALCCEYAEDNIDEVLKNYNLESLEQLHDETVVVWTNNERVLYQAY